MRTVDVSQSLDKRLLLFGFEVADVLAIFLVLSVLNFLFGQTPLKVVLVWLPTLALALVLRYGKQGRPEKYLIHWLRFQIKPGRLSAFAPPTLTEPPPKRKKVPPCPIR